MKIRHSTSTGPDKVEMQMTPMIDVVFQLLTFFLFSFKIATVEGDFNIKMPLAAAQQTSTPPPTVPPIQVRLTAGPDGELTGIRMGQQPLASFEELHLQIRSLLPASPVPGASDGAEVELDCDYNLKYENVIQAITAVSGYVSEQGVVRLIEKIKFAPPRPPAGAVE
jgi:biopolymer transport protein ExbD